MNCLGGIRPKGQSLTLKRWYRQTIYLQKRRKKDSPAFGIAKIYQYKDLRTSLKKSTERLIIAAINSNDNKRTNRKTQTLDRDLIVNEIISECSKLARNDHKTRYDWVANAKTRIHPREWKIKFCSILKYKQITKSWPKSRPSINYQEKETCHLVDFFFYGGGLSENKKKGEKIDRHLDVAEELKKAWNMRVTVIPLIVGALGAVLKVLLKRL